MSTQETKLSPDQAHQPKEKGSEIRELIKRGKAKGMLSQAEIMEALEDVDYDIEQIEKLYETLENMGIEFIYNTRIGQDIAVDELKKDYVAVLFGLGASKENGAGISGEEYLKSGIEFLHGFSCGKQIEKINTKKRK